MPHMTLSQAFCEGVAEEMRADPGVIVLGTDLVDRGGHFGQIKGLGASFPDRVFDTPISEAAMVAAGVGAALNGLRPIVDLNFMDFALGAMDEIVNQAAKMRYLFGAPVPMVIRGTAGIALFAAQHNNSLEAAFAHTPGLLVVMPSTPSDARALIKSAVRSDDPVIFLMHKSLTGLRGEVSTDDLPVPIGSARVCRAGSSLTLVAYGALVARCLHLADRLAREDIEIEVIDLRSLFPLDMSTILGSADRTRHVVVVSEAPRHGGLTSEIAATVQEELFDVLARPVLRVGARHAPIPHSPALIAAAIPSEADLERAVRWSLHGKVDES